MPIFPQCCLKKKQSFHAVHFLLLRRYARYLFLVSRFSKNNQISHLICCFLHFKINTRSSRSPYNICCHGISKIFLKQHLSYCIYFVEFLFYIYVGVFKLSLAQFYCSLLSLCSRQTKTKRFVCQLAVAGGDALVKLEQSAGCSSHAHKDGQKKCCTL